MRADRAVAVEYAEAQWHWTAFDVLHFEQNLAAIRVIDDEIDALRDAGEFRFALELDFLRLEILLEQ